MGEEYNLGDYSVGKVTGGVGIQNDITVNGDINIDKSNKSIKSLLVDYYDLRKGMLGFLLKLMITMYLIFLSISIIGMKYYNFDKFYNLFMSSFLSAVWSAVYLWIAYIYYKQKRERSKSDEAVVLLFFDLVMVSIFYYINFVIF
jgi:hypothetical protein